MAKITELKREIVQRRLLQADLAEATGIHETRLSRIVNGRVKPKDYERKQLASALGKTVEELPV